MSSLYVYAEIIEHFPQSFLRDQAFASQESKDRSSPSRSLRPGRRTHIVDLNGIILLDLHLEGGVQDAFHPLR